MHQIVFEIIGMHGKPEELPHKCVYICSANWLNHPQHYIHHIQTMLVLINMHWNNTTKK